MRFYKKIRAGSLQFVLFIGVVIAILLLTFITLSHTHTFFGKKTALFIDTVKKTDLGMEYAIKNQMPLNDTTALNLGLDDAITLKGVKKYWGVFENYTIVSTTKKNRFIKCALVGGSISEEPIALYLKDNQRPMIIVGKAKITGDAFLPKQGIRPGNISGNSYYGTSLLYGRQRESRAQLPKLNTEMRKYIEQLSSTYFNGGQDALQLSNGMSVQNSFTEDTKFIYGNVINLSGVSLTGNIIVKATNKIIVDTSAKLTDIILIAPEISIKNGTKGTFQAIASKHISVGKKCELSYPSALVVYDKSTAARVSNTVSKPNININSNSIVKGPVVYMGPTKERQFYPQIKIDTNAQIWGEVYCEQNIEHKGMVFGTVTTNGFIALENGSIYQNHLYNGTINNELLPYQYSGLSYQGNNSNKAISKWLY